MALTIKTETLKATTSPTFEALRNRYSRNSSDAMRLPSIRYVYLGMI